MVTKVQKLTHPTKSHRLRRLVYWFVGWAPARPKFPSVLTHNGVLCIIWSLIKRFDRFTRPRRQGSQVWLSFSYENSRGCFI